jgi:hypothetical protein
MPKGAEVLTVQPEDGGEPALWALVDPMAETEERVFMVPATGDAIESAGLWYVGSFVKRDGYVGHVFGVSA